MMITSDTLRRIRRIEIRTRKLVNESFAGAYHSVFKGRGMVFDSVRPYEPGDSPRDIDWNVTARMGQPFVKQYVEERELTVMLALDASASCLFGTARARKRDLAAELGAVLAYSAIRNQDRVGLLIFSDQIERYVAPRKGRNHILRLIRDLLTLETEGRGTDLGTAFKTLNRLLKRRSVIFVMSDFLESPETYRTTLALLARRHDVIAVVLSDPRERVWPDAGLVCLVDAETGELQYVDTHDARWRTGFERQAQRFQTALHALLDDHRIDRIDLQTDQDYVRALTQFFERRSRRLGL